MKYLIILVALFAANFSQAQVITLTTRDTTSKKLVTQTLMNAISPNVYKLAVTANTTVVIPANKSITQVVIQNNTGNLVLGGIKVGTTSGAADVIATLAVGANAYFAVSDAAMLKKAFSPTTDQTLYIQSITGWNGANLNFYFVLRTIYAP